MDTKPNRNRASTGDEPLSSSVSSGDRSTRHQPLSANCDEASVVGLSEPAMEFGAVGKKSWPDGIEAINDCGPICEINISQKSKSPKSYDEILAATMSLSLEERQLFLSMLQKSIAAEAQ